MAITKKLFNGRMRYTIAVREPFQFPSDVVKIPAPPQAPNPPSSPSLLTLLLPPAIMLVGSLISALTIKSQSWIAILPMMLMGLGYPAANLISNQVQKKKYVEFIEKRKIDYQKVIKEYQSKINQLIERQRIIFETEFPNLDSTLQIGMSCGKNKRLWWRRPGEKDFLNLRAGTGDSGPSFKIEPPNMLGGDDPLYKLPFQLIENYQSISNIPFLVDLKHIGSLLIYSDKISSQIRLARRLLVDIIVHHSPEDINLFVISDRVQAAEIWEWLRWAPHVHALDAGYEGQNLLFNIDKINGFLDGLKRIFFERLEQQRSYSSNNTFVPSPSIVVLLDDTGVVRQNPDIARIAAEGFLVGIYLIFLTNDKIPRTCRGRVEVDKYQRLSYLETIELHGISEKRMGVPELVTGEQACKLSKLLAGLEVAGGKHTHTLPSTVKISDIVNGKSLSQDQIYSNWLQNIQDSDQVLLPVGQFVDRSGLMTFEIDFRPESIGGKGAYHAMMIGTTGSGKSIFMQSMVLASAYKYSPRQINFMFMDFKAGAAELKKINNLPHSVGMVTDLSPALADRALQALENELSNRKIIFDNAGKVTDIWDFNRRFPDQSIPHLLVVVDEFAEGINILPNLVERLKELGRQGRAFGMYFFLANQEVNSAVDQLKSNVGWYILLKVNRKEEMNLIGHNYPVPPGRGRGYIKVKNDVTTIQGAYAGVRANIAENNKKEINEFSIQIFGMDGQRKELYRFDPREQDNFEVGLTELDVMMEMIEQVANRLNVPKAKPIYLEPLNEIISFSEVYNQLDVFRFFENNQWDFRKGERNVLPIGFLDIPNRCLQTPFCLNFNEAGGHLWVIGNPGSGKTTTLLSIGAVLCLTHSPLEANIYALDFGNGMLAWLSKFPHTGAVIRAHEGERIDRLFWYLNKQLQERSEKDWRNEGMPDVFLLINNIADFRQQYPERADELGRYIRSGGAVGIHVIITSNRGSELPRTISGNITRRIVLQLAERQEYMDVLNAIVPPMSIKTEGRGYYLADEIAECQISLPLMDIYESEYPLFSNDAFRTLSKQQKKDLIISEVNKVITKIGHDMKISWHDNLPQEILTMPEIVEKKHFRKILEKSINLQNADQLSLGVRYDDLEIFNIPIGHEIPFWTVLGPRSNGKSSFLLALIYYIEQIRPEKCKFTYINFKKSPISKVADDFSNITVISETEQISSCCQNFCEELNQDPENFHVLLMDDLGTPFVNNNQPIIQALKTLGENLSMIHNENFLIVISDMVSNLKAPQAFSSPLIKIFQQSQTGIFFSADDYDMQWFNVRISLSQKKMFTITPGRGFFVSKGKPEHIQAPYIIPEDFKDFLGTR